MSSSSFQKSCLPIFVLVFRIVLVAPVCLLQFQLAGFARELKMWQVTEKVSLTGVASCFIPGLTHRVKEQFGRYGDRTFDICVVPSSLVITEKGARVQMFYATGTGANYPVEFTSYFLEADCRTMQDRSKADWSFSKDQPSEELMRRYRYFYAADVGVWGKYQERDPWFEWKPITNLTEQHKWICRQWSLRPSAKQWIE